MEKESKKIGFTAEQEKLKNRLLSPFWFRLMMLSQVPMVWIARIRLIKLNESESATTIPFTYLNKNPFKSIYFAAQSMAAELSTATPILVAVTDKKPSIAFILVDLSSVFHKKAIGKVTFNCLNVSEAYEAVEQAATTGEAVQITLVTEGSMTDGTVVSTFKFTWSMKRRKPKNKR